MRFDPRPRAEGDLNMMEVLRYGKSFDPRPRAEGDRYETEPLMMTLVSIHALARRATAAF